MLTPIRGGPEIIYFGGAATTFILVLVYFAWNASREDLNDKANVAITFLGSFMGSFLWPLGLVCVVVWAVIMLPVNKLRAKYLARSRAKDQIEDTLYRGHQP
jgi:hypothetical protein